MRLPWYERYRWRFDNYRLPKKKNEREQMAWQIGLDGHYLLDQIWRINDEDIGLRQGASQSCKNTRMRSP
jgi:hypothetical protein